MAITLKAARVNKDLTQRKSGCFTRYFGGYIVSTMKKAKLSHLSQSLLKMEELYGLSYNDINFFAQQKITVKP